MTLATLNFLVGGLGMFLLGMWLMTDGLKLAAGEALQAILSRWTRTSGHAFASGFLITAVVQSSSATTVATVGFVNAGLMPLYQAIWVVIGSNAGTTITGWLVALIGIKVDIGTFALLLLGSGMMARLIAGSSARRAGIGQAVAGFGAFFMGIDLLQSAFGDLAPQFAQLPLANEGVMAMLAFTMFGIMLTVLTQSSSAAIAIILTASATGSIELPLAASAVIGTNIGTTSTTVFAALGATPAARRVAAAHVVFNAIAAASAFVMLPLLLWASLGTAQVIDGTSSTPTVLAVFHTLFNFLGALIVWPMRQRFSDWLSRRFVTEVEDMGRPCYLDSTLLPVPAIAMRGLAMEIDRLAALGFDETRRAIGTEQAEPGAADRRSALLRLSGEVRQFVAQLGATRLPADMADALPSMIRATQHIDEALVASSTLAARVGDRRSARHATLAALEQAVLECLSIRNGNVIDLPHADLLEERASRLDATYEEEKASLLTAAADGRMPVGAMEHALERAQLLRRCGMLAIKTQRRLAGIAPIMDLRADREARGQRGEDLPDAISPAPPSP